MSASAAVNYCRITGYHSDIHLCHLAEYGANYSAIASSLVWWHDIVYPRQLKPESAPKGLCMLHILLCGARDIIKRHAARRRGSPSPCIAPFSLTDCGEPPDDEGNARNRQWPLFITTGAIRLTSSHTGNVWAGLKYR